MIMNNDNFLVKNKKILIVMNLLFQSKIMYFFSQFYVKKQRFSRQQKKFDE